MRRSIPRFVALVTLVATLTMASSCSAFGTQPAATVGGVDISVDDIEDVVARLRTHGAELVGELAQYEDIYRLCYVRGPEGIIVGLAEQLS